MKNSFALVILCTLLTCTATENDRTHKENNKEELGIKAPKQVPTKSPSYTQKIAQFVTQALELVDKTNEDGPIIECSLQ